MNSNPPATELPRYPATPLPHYRPPPPFFFLFLLFPIEKVVEKIGKKKENGSRHYH